MAVSSEPDTVMAFRNPAAMARTPVSTATTPAIPIAADNAAPRRAGMLLRLKTAMDRIWDREFMEGSGRDLVSGRVTISTPEEL